MVKKMSLIKPLASFAAFVVASGRSWEEGHPRVLVVPGCDSGYVVLHLLPRDVAVAFFSLRSFLFCHQIQ